jgi:hypothetical protein
MSANIFNPSWNDALKFGGVPGVDSSKLPSNFSGSSSGSGGMAFPIGAVAGVASSLIGGLFGKSAAEQQAEALKAAARERTTESLAKDFAGYGLDLATTEYNQGPGEFAKRLNALKEAQQSAVFQAYNPAAQKLRSNERFGRVQDYAASLSAAMPGYVSPLNLFG